MGQESGDDTEKETSEKEPDLVDDAGKGLKSIVDYSKMLDDLNKTGGENLDKIVGNGEEGEPASGDNSEADK